MMWRKTVAVAVLVWLAMSCSSNAKSPGLDAATDGRTVDARRVDGGPGAGRLSCADIGCSVQDLSLKV